MCEVQAPAALRGGEGGNARALSGLQVWADLPRPGTAGAGAGAGAALSQQRAVRCHAAWSGHLLFPEAFLMIEQTPIQAPPLAPAAEGLAKESPGAVTTRAWAFALTLPRVRVVDAVCVTGVLLLYAAVSSSALAHQGVWSHLKYGEWIWQHGELPEKEPFCPWSDQAGSYV